MNKANLTEQERLAVVEVHVGNIKTEQTEIKGDVKEIRGILQNLPEALVSKLDERYALRQDVADMKETIDPLTSLRKRIWSVYIFAALSLAVLTTILIDYVKGKIAG